MTRLGLLVLLAGSGCAMGLGASVEANGGVVRVTSITDGATVENDPEWALTAGLSFNVEFDENRDANLTAGFGPQIIHPSNGPRDVSEIPMQLTYGASIENLGWKLRPRGYFGFAYANEDPAFLSVHMGLGGSIHPARGWAVHVSSGPQVVFGGSSAYAEPGITYRGVGGEVRVRIFRMFAKKCDPLEAPRHRFGSDPFSAWNDPC